MDGEEEQGPSESNCGTTLQCQAVEAYENVDVVATVVVDYVVAGLVDPTQDTEPSNGLSPYSSSIHHYQLSSEAYSDGQMMAEKRLLKQTDQSQEEFPFLIES